MRPGEWVAHHSATALTRLAGVLTLFALGIMVYSVLVPRPLSIVLAMSVGQAVGGTSFVCFFLAVVIDAAKSKRTSIPPPAPESTENEPSTPLSS